MCLRFVDSVHFFSIIKNTKMAEDDYLIGVKIIKNNKTQY